MSGLLEPVSPTAPPSRSVRLLRGRGAGLVLFACYFIAMALLVVSSVIDFRNARVLEETGASVSRTIESAEKLRTIGNTFSIAEASQRGYLLTGNPVYLAPFREMQQKIPVRLAEVSSLVSDTPVQVAAVERLRGLAQDKFGEMQHVLDAYRDGGEASAMALFGQGDGIQTTTAVRDVINGMLAEESRLLGERRAAAASAYSNALLRALVATMVVGVALTVFYFLMHRFLRQRDDALSAVEANNIQLEQRVIDRTEDLSHLSRHLLDVREHEKKVIARDLHDDFGSYLTAINMDVSRARDKISATNPEQAAKLERTLGLLTSAIEMKRQLISELRPSLLDNLGLGPALEQYIEEWSQRAQVQASFDYEGDLKSDEGCLISIFRVFQEALNNIAKHAQAKRVAAYAYRTDDVIEFEIADDGIGIADADRSKVGVHGLLGIRERVLAYQGRCDIERGPNGGTIVRGSMPARITVGARPTAPSAV